jgi:hypothetical protein
MTKSEKDFGEDLIWFGGTKAACKLTDVLADLTTRQLGDYVLMNAANTIKHASMVRARHYLATFLNGKGSDQQFPLSELLLDAGVRGVIWRHFNAPLTHKKNVITIGQSAYTNLDWKHSLGTYFIYYIDVGNRPNLFGKETRHVLAWGEDTYQWAPDDVKRFTQCIHQAASRLQRTERGLAGINIPKSATFGISNADILLGLSIPKAATFKMFATDTLLDTTTGGATFTASLSTVKAQEMSKKAHIARERAQPMCRGR